MHVNPRLTSPPYGFSCKQLYSLWSVMQCLYTVNRGELFAATFYLFCDKQRDMNTIVFMKRILFSWLNLASREQRGREKNTYTYHIKFA